MEKNISATLSTFNWESCGDKFEITLGFDSSEEKPFDVSIWINGNDSADYTVLYESLHDAAEAFNTTVNAAKAKKIKN